MTSKTSLAGLSRQVAAARLATAGYNELPTPDQRGPLRILAQVLKEPMFALLIAGGIVYLLLGDRLEAILLLIFASLSVVITLVQEWRSEKVLDALRQLASPRALVIRDGHRLQIPGREVVPGDLLVLSEGERVPADAALLTADDLMVDESLLTGESLPVLKKSDATHYLMTTLDVQPAALTQNNVFAGTLVVRGAGKAMVYGTGAQSEMGKIGKAIGSIDPEQPRLHQELRWLVRDFAIVGALTGLLSVLLFGLLRGSWLQGLLGGIALGMSMLPEEFPLVVTVFMAMGAWRISQARVLTRRASAVESLGSITVLCTDKTGTLTENRMRVVSVSGSTGPLSALGLLPLPAVSRDVLATAVWACQRDPVDPMDVALYAVATDRQEVRESLSDTLRLVRTYGISPQLSAVVNVLVDDSSRDRFAVAKGSIEAIAQLCRMPSADYAEVLKQMDVVAAQGMRVLAVARADILMGAQQTELPDSPTEFRFSYLGCVAFADPVRASVAAAVAECHSAGIRVVMVTGDYPATACAIGRQAGLDVSRYLTGDELEALSDAELTERVRATCIYARVRPHQKLRIVQSLKANGEIVGMTGDGVNDAPALKAAHIGVAMGGRGSDVAREAAALVLLDDDFGSIVKTIRLGRRIYDNLRKAVEYIIAVHIPIAGIAMLPLLFGLPLMLAPIHIAFLEMIIDPACSMVFEAESEERDVMHRPPRGATVRLLIPRRMVWALIQGGVAFMVVAGVLFTAVAMKMPEPDMRALVFACLVLINMGLIIVNRSFESSLSEALRRPNKVLWLLLAGVVSLLAVSLAWPPARTLFRFGRLHGDDVAACLVIGVLSLLGLECIKSLWFRVPKRAADAT